jgi:hypothetical protein
MAMSKKSGGKQISEREKARRRAAAEAAQAAKHGEPSPEKLAGKDLHPNMAKPRIIRHQGR